MTKTYHIFKLILLIIAFNISSLVYAQENKIDIFIAGGSSNYILNIGDSKSNLSSYALDFGLTYNFPKNNYIKAELNLGEDISSKDEFLFDSYQASILYGFYTYAKDSSNISFFVEFGPSLRGIYGFKDFSENNYKKKNSLGINANLGMHFELSTRSFTRVYLNTNRDFKNVFESESDSVKMRKYAMMIGIGFKL